MNTTHYTNDTAVQEYFKTNPIVEKFILDLNMKIVAHYTTTLPNLELPIIAIDIGRIYIRIWVGTSCWGFISRVDGKLKNTPIKKGDLLKPASWRTPAKHSRGNIADGTAKYDVYGPEYLK